MANYLNHELCRIVRDIAYGKGQARKIKWLIVRLNREQKKIEERLAQIPLELEEAERVLKAIEGDLNISNEKARDKFPWMPLHDIREIVPTPKTGNWEWGDFKRELIHVLKEANGRPISTRQLVDHCSARFGIEEVRTAHGGKLREAVSKRLREMAAKGIIRRLPSPSASAPAYWVWVGLE